MAPFQTTVCNDAERRLLIEQDQNLNGIDYVEVVTSPAAENERVLQVFFIPKDPSNAIGQTNLTLLMQKLAIAPQEVTIQGGVRVQNIQVLGVSFVVDHIEVSVSSPGDFSAYTLRINDPAVDIFYSQVQFNFKAGCPTHFDCRPQQICPPVVLKQPAIDYMAKDYASFRQALIDLIPTLKPSWTERHEADIGMALLELLAYAGDQFSYYQDAVSNELFLKTARQRISVRRLVRLIDYQMHDGASARAFIQFQLAAGTTGLLPAGTQVLSKISVPIGNSQPPLGPVFTAADADAARIATNAIFETFNTVPVPLSDRLNLISVYTWGNAQCCLPRGTTSVYLLGDLAGPDPLNPWKLAVGDFLLFEEVLGPVTGLAADADPARRQVVRLTQVERATDPLEKDPITGVPPTLLTLVSWAPEDALTFPLCLSVKLANTAVVNGVSVARGNLVLADHGQTLQEWFPGDPADPSVPGIITGPRAFRFLLQRGPLSFRIPYDPADGPSTTVASLLVTDPHTAAPQVTELDVHIDTQTLSGWVPLATLLESNSQAQEFVVETENDGRALLRFGDGVYGMAPPNGSHISVQYRIGEGSNGNVGADSLVHVINDGAIGFPSLKAVRNPLAAWGGTDPQPIEQVKLLAPAAIQAVQHRAVTEEDYAQAAEKWPEVAQAVATFRFTGSWYTVFITVDPVGRNDLPADMAQRVRQWVTSYTQAGYDLEINAPVYAPLDIVIDICVAPYHFRGDVEEAVLNALSNRILPDGSCGFFYPDNFSFGQPLYLSQLYAAVRAVQGVDSASVTRFQRYGELSQGELQKGYIATDRLEIVRLDNDPNFQENGVLRLNMGGGK